MANLKTIGERIQAARAQLGMSQKDVAKAAGISQPTLWALEDGTAKGTKHLLKLARVLRQTPEWLDEGVGEMVVHDTAHAVRAKPGKKIKVLPVDMSFYRKRHATIIGTVRAGVLRPREDIPPGEREIVTMLTKRIYDDVEIVVISLADRSADRAFQAGSLLECVAVADLPEPLRDGDHVIVYRDRNGQRETVCMLLHIEDGKRRLVLNTTDRDLITYPSIELDEKPAKGEEITLAFCVLASSVRRQGR